MKAQSLKAKTSKAQPQKAKTPKAQPPKAKAPKAQPPKAKAKPPKAQKARPAAGGRAPAGAAAARRRPPRAAAARGGPKRSPRAAPVPGGPKRSARAAPAADGPKRSARAAPAPDGPKRPAGRRTGLFLLLFLSVVFLVLLGVVMGLSATAAPSLSETNSPWSLFRRHLMWVVLGAVALVVMMRVDYRRWRPLVTAGMVAALGLLAATAMPAFGLTVNGAQRWISIGPVTLQPSEPAKLALVLFIADILSRPGRSILDHRATLRPVLTVAAAMICLLMMQPHLGASVITTAIFAAMLWFAGTRLLPLAGLGVFCLAAVLMVIKLSPWRWERMLGFINPWDDPLGNGYQPLQSLHALASGGINGVGLGAGRSKWGFLPYAHTDFILAVIGEELGLLGTLLVTGLFAVIGVAGYCAALRAPDRFGMLAAVGVTTWILVQAIINIGTVVAVFPVVGITLPLLSFGGSSLVATMAAMGLLLNVARHAR